MSVRNAISVLIAVSLLLISGASYGRDSEDDATVDGPVALVVVIVVDQLRADMPGELLARFGPGGFRRFYEQGVVYPNGVMRFAPTSTGPGHATLATGTLPARHGVIGNQWWDTELGREVNCVADPGQRGLGPGNVAGGGVSPHLLESETFTDVIHAASKGLSRTLSFSIKDRSAVIPAGRRGDAVWYSKRTGTFVSSDYYFDALPAWLDDFNEERMGDLDGAVWELLQARSEYRFGDRDDQSWEMAIHGPGRVFPHRLADAGNRSSALRFMPLADQLVVDLARGASLSTRLGQGPTTDVLILGLSASDYIGHAYGPDSLEWEDNLLRLDALLSELFSWLDGHVGMDHVLVGLSSDHGVASVPEYRMAHGLPSGRVDTPGLERGLREFLRDRLDIEGDPVLGASYPLIYLDEGVLQAAGIPIEIAERAAAGHVLETEGIADVIIRSDILTGRVPASLLNDRVVAGFHARRSGHLFLIQGPHWFMEEDPDYYAATHGSPYDYDARVPLMFLAPGLTPQVVEREVGTEDFAPSITGYLGLRPPGDATGTGLAEITGGVPVTPYNSPNR